MQATRLIRLSGSLMILGALSFAISEIADALGADPFSTISALAEALAFVLLPFGFLGVYGVQSDRAGWLGLLGTFLYVLGAGMNIAVVGGALVYRSVIPGFEGAATVFAIINSGGLGGAIAILGIVLFLLGTLTFGGALWKANLVPRGSVVLMLLGVILANAVLMISPQIGHVLNLIMLAGLVWMGWWLRQHASMGTGG